MSSERATRLPRRLPLSLALALVVVGLVAVSAPSRSATASAATYWEQEGHHGVNTFTNYHNASGMGPKIPPAAWVEVSCKVYDPYIASVNPDGYWYRIASSPWNNQYYSPANTFMNGDPWDGPYYNYTDFGVPDCGSTPDTTSPPPPPPPPPPAPSIVLNQGSAAPKGFWYSMVLSDFAPNSAISVTCHDSVDAGGFRSFTIRTDANGYGASGGGCYSADGPDHWVTAGGVASNHVSWNGSSGGGGGSTTTEIPPASTAPPAHPQSVFYSGTDTPTGVGGVSPATQNLPISQWTNGECGPDRAVSAVDFGAGSVETLSGWSKGRLGPVYFLSAAGADRVSRVHRIVLFDPGSSSEMDKPSFWASLWNPTCDWRYDINSLLANWLRANAQNRLLVFTGAASEMKDDSGEPKYWGLWDHYFTGLWNQPFADRSIICNYDEMDHKVVLRTFAYMVTSDRFECPDGPGRTTPWHP